jgi:hypothetical protein
MVELTGCGDYNSLAVVNKSFNVQTCFIRLLTKSEPGAVATGEGLNGKTDPSNAKSLKNLSIRPVATAPGTDFVLACSPYPKALTPVQH